MRANSGALNLLVVTVGRPCCQLGLKTHLRSAESRSHAGLRSYARCRARWTAGHSRTSAWPRQGSHRAEWSLPAISPGCSALSEPWPKRPPGRRWIRSTAAWLLKRSSLLAARSLLAWSQEDLATAAEVSIPTIKRLGAQDGPLGGRVNQAPRFVRRWNQPVLSSSTRTAAAPGCGFEGGATGRFRQVRRVLAGLPSNQRSRSRGQL
jgi:hypothetical protein